MREKAGYNTNTPLIAQTSAKNFATDKKPHVIFVLMEGWSSHVASQHHADNQVLGEFKKHAEQDYFNLRFFSNAYGTNPTIEYLLLNSPVTPVSQSSASKTKFTQSNVWPFKSHGYQALFLSGGYEAWRNHNKFWIRQGFDNYIGRSTMEAHYNTVANNPWGIYEELLFDYLKQQLLNAEQIHTPLFSFVMTTNNHPPVRLPESYQAPPLNLSYYGHDNSDAHRLSMLQGYHYQSDQLGKFLSWLKSSELKDDVIVVATGDHILKGFDEYNTTQMQFFRYAVPVYFYVPEQLNQLKTVSQDIVGSHMDLFPTLLELSLSQAKYYQFGSTLMAKKEAQSYGWIEGHHRFLFDDGVVNSEAKSFFPWQEQAPFLLSDQAQPLQPFHEVVIEKSDYLNLLQQWLLLSDYEAGKSRTAAVND